MALLSENLQHLTYPSHQKHASKAGGHQESKPIVMEDFSSQKMQ
jgi:hypothetical protein